MLFSFDHFPQMELSLFLIITTYSTIISGYSAGHGDGGFPRAPAHACQEIPAPQQSGSVSGNSSKTYISIEILLVLTFAKGTVLAGHPFVQKENARVDVCNASVTTNFAKNDRDANCWSFIWSRSSPAEPHPQVLSPNSFCIYLTSE